MKVVRTGMPFRVYLVRQTYQVRACPAGKAAGGMQAHGCARNSEQVGSQRDHAIDGLLVALHGTVLLQRGHSLDMNAPCAGACTCNPADSALTARGEVKQSRFGRWLDFCLAELTCPEELFSSAEADVGHLRLTAHLQL